VDTFLEFYACLVYLHRFLLPACLGGVCSGGCSRSAVGVHSGYHSLGTCSLFCSGATWSGTWSACWSGYLWSRIPASGNFSAVLHFILSACTVSAGLFILNLPFFCCLPVLPQSGCRFSWCTCLPPSCSGVPAVRARCSAWAWVGGGCRYRYTAVRFWAPPPCWSSTLHHTIWVLECVTGWSACLFWVEEWALSLEWSSAGGLLQVFLEYLGACSGFLFLPFCLGSACWVQCSEFCLLPFLLFLFSGPGAVSFSVLECLVRTPPATCTYTISTTACGCDTRTRHYRHFCITCTCIAYDTVHLRYLWSGPPFVRWAVLFCSVLFHFGGTCLFCISGLGCMPCISCCILLFLVGWVLGSQVQCLGGCICFRCRAARCRWVEQVGCVPPTGWAAQCWERLLP